MDEGTKNVLGEVERLLYSIEYFNKWAGERKFYTPEDELEHYKAMVGKWSKRVDSLRIDLTVAFDGILDWSDDEDLDWPTD